jgi:hypothetical protein
VEHIADSSASLPVVYVDMHARDARKAGESEDRVFAVAAWRESSYFTDAERAAFALTELVTRLADRPDPMPDEVWDAAAQALHRAAADRAGDRHRNGQPVEPGQRGDPAGGRAGGLIRPGGRTGFTVSGGA